MVALLMASREVRGIYRRRYADQVSIISSQMAGRPIRRPTDLRLLTTTSLYGVASSQYNRLKLRRTEHGGLGDDIVWEQLDEPTAGYGTVHLSGVTVDLLRALSRQQHRAHRINSVFGEGASPRLRQVREGLDVLGIKSDLVLHHATPRLCYACKLGETALEDLMGFSNAQACPEAPGTETIAAAWRERWLAKRIGQPDVLQRLAHLGPWSVRLDLIPADDSGQFCLPFGDMQAA